MQLASNKFNSHGVLRKLGVRVPKQFFGADVSMNDQEVD